MKKLCVVLVLVAVLVVGQPLVAQCADLLDERTDYETSPDSRAQHQKKIDYATAVISNNQDLSHNAQCVARALLFLGTFHVEETIPRMIELLTFEYNPINPLRAGTRNQRYPAIAGLAGMGKPAIPALLGAIANTQTGSTEALNAMYALMTMHQEHPAEGIAMLQKAANAEDNQIVAERFRELAVKAQSIWCKDSKRCVNLPN